MPKLAADTRAWTAASVPVVLRVDGDELSLGIDDARDVEVREVEFETLNPLADRDQVMDLLLAAVPGAVGEVFGTLPAVTLPSFVVSRLDDTPGPERATTRAALEGLADAWALRLELVRAD